MLYGRYKCLKSTFQFILTDIGCDKEAVSFFESQGFFLIADRTFSFHDENAYEGNLVDLAEHFFDVLSVENELIYGKVRAGYDMRFEGFLAEDRNGLRYLESFFDMKVTFFSIRFLASVIINTIGHVRVLLDLSDHISLTDCMDRARFDEQHFRKF